MVIDLIIIVIIALCIILGYKRGLIGVAFKFLSFIIALILSIILYEPVANYIIYNTTIDEKIEETIIQNIDAERFQTNEEGTIEKGESNTPQVIIDYINETIVETANNAKSEIVDIVAEKLSVTAIKIISIIGIFVIIRIVLIILNAVADLVAKIPVIKQFNKLGGVIYGVLEGMLIIYIILALCSIIAPLITNFAIVESINTSFIGKMMYNNNILLKLMF